VAAGLFRGIKREIFYQQRTGTDETHLAAQNVEELGHFVQGESAQETPKAGESLRIRKQVSG
jgi:hypothetical protein